MFCNPPYGRALGAWVRKAYEEAQAGTTVVLLIPARTDTAYFHDYIYGKAEIRFLRGRLHFEDEDGNRFPPAPFPSIFKSITFDNGTEFAAAEGLERSCVNKRLPRTKVYFCHPYSSWERGTNENTNGMIRRRFPKGTNFAAVTNAQIAQAENWINNYPRKILGYKSSEIVFRECLRELGIAA